MLFHTLLCGLVLAPAGIGGLEGLFTTTSKDFGSVPHGSINTHRFVLKNTSSNTVHVNSVRSSCRCATPRALQETAAPGEELAIEVAYNASTFTGHRSMTITVTFDQPSLESVSLRVSGYSETSINFDPGQIDFGIIQKGAAPSQSARININSSSTRIEDVIASPNVTAKLEPNGSSYNVVVGLKPGLEPSIIDEDIQLKTNDSKMPIVKLHVAGMITAPLVASPSSLQLGSVGYGQTVTKKVLLKGDRPFEIEWVGGQAEGVKVLCSTGPRKMHILEIHFMADHSGKFEKTLEVKTNLEKEAVLPFKILANVDQQAAVQPASGTTSPAAP